MPESGVTVQIRGGDGRMQPLTATARVRLLRQSATTRWAAARTGAGRLAVAVDYLRALAAVGGRGGVDPSADVERATRAVWAAAESFARQLTDTEDGGHRG